MRELSLSARPVSATDLDWIAACEQSAVRFPWSRAAFESSMEAGHLCLLAVAGQSPVAYSVSMLVLDELHILNIVVTPEHQGRGVGRWLLDETMRRAAAPADGPVLLEVRVSNDAARSLYRSLGFVEVGIRKGYYPSEDGRENAIVMCKERHLAA